MSCHHLNFDRGSLGAKERQECRGQWAWKEGLVVIPEIVLVRDNDDSLKWPLWWWMMAKYSEYISKTELAWIQSMGQCLLGRNVECLWNVQHLIYLDVYQIKEKS